MAKDDRYADIRVLVRQALELARRVGDRTWETIYLVWQTYLMGEAGEWDEALEQVAEVRRSPDIEGYNLGRLLPVVGIYVQRGNLDAARELLEVNSALEHSEEVQSRAQFAWAQAVLFQAEGDFVAALAAASRAAQARDELGVSAVKHALVAELDAAMVLDSAKAEELLSYLEHLRPGETTPLLSAQAVRLRAKLSPETGDQSFSAAVAMFRDLAMPFWLAVALLEYGEWLAARDRAVEADPLLSEARGIFERLRARPWLDRLAAVTRVETISA